MTSSIVSILHSCSRYIDSCPTTFDGQAVAAIMTGVKSLPTSLPATRGILTSLATNLKANHDRISLSSIELSLAVNGLQSTTADEKFAIELVKIFNGFACKLTRSNPTAVFTTGSEISSTLNGLRHIGLDHADAENILEIVIRSLVLTKDKSIFNEKELSSAFFALQKLQLNSVVSKNCVSLSQELVFLLSEALSRYQGKLSGRSVANILYGLQNMKVPPPLLLRYNTTEISLYILLF